MSNDPRSTAGERVFHGVRFDIRAVELSGRDGTTTRGEYIAHPGGVVVMPVLEDGRIVLIRNQRFPVGETLWELPAGTLELGEEPAVCAAREVEEETGYRAGEITPLTAFYSTPGFCDEKLHGFVARGLEPVGQSLDPTESIEVEAVSEAEALAMIRDGRLRDAKTICLLLYDSVFRRGA